MSDAATIELELWRQAFPGKTPGEVREALDRPGRNYKNRAEFALYIADEIQAYHKLARLSGWSKEEITLVDLAAELRAALGRVEVKE